MKFINEPSQPFRREWRSVGELSQPEQGIFVRNRQSAAIDCRAKKSVRLNIVRHVSFTGKAENCCWPARKQQAECRLAGKTIDKLEELYCLNCNRHN